MVVVKILDSKTTECNSIGIKNSTCTSSIYTDSPTISFWDTSFGLLVKVIGISILVLVIIFALVSVIIFGSFHAWFAKLAKENRAMADLQRTEGSDFPGSDYRCSDRKNWMSALNPERLRVNQIAWPGSHDSATNGMLFFVRPFAECETRSIYEQLKMGTRVLDIRVNEDRRVVHGPIINHNVEHVLNDVKRFLHEADSEIIILEIRTEFGHDDPPEFAEYLIDQLGEYLIPQDDQVFDKTISELLPKRIICVWKPLNSPEVSPGGALWSSHYLRDNWIDTDLPYTKFKSNMRYLGEQPQAVYRNYFYRIENTVTPKLLDPFISATDRIKPYARLFISQCFSRGMLDKLQILSTDFISEDFVDACIGLTRARVEEKA